MGRCQSMPERVQPAEQDKGSHQCVPTLALTGAQRSGAIKRSRCRSVLLVFLPVIMQRLLRPRLRCRGGSMRSAGHAFHVRGAHAFFSGVVVWLHAGAAVHRGCRCSARRRRSRRTVLLTEGRQRGRRDECHETDGSKVVHGASRSVQAGFSIRMTRTSRLTGIKPVGENNSASSVVEEDARHRVSTFLAPDA